MATWLGNTNRIMEEPLVTIKRNAGTGIVIGKKNMKTIKGKKNIIIEGDCIQEMKKLPGGSGTTCIAAQKLQMNFIGIEINSGYCKLARERLACQVNL